MVLPKSISLVAWLVAALVLCVSVFATSLGARQMSADALSALLVAQPEFSRTESPGLSEGSEVPLSATDSVTPAGGADEVSPPALEVEANSAYHSYDVHLAVDGLLAGRLSAFDTEAGHVVATENLPVTLSRYDGSVIQTETAVGGVFQAEGVLPGVYSLTAAGPQGFLALAINVLPPSANVDGDVERNARGALWIDAVLCGHSDVPSVNQLLADNDPATTDREMGQAVRAAVLPVVSTPLMNHVAVVAEDGRLPGRIRRIEASTGAPLQAGPTRVYFLRNGQIVSSTAIDGAGVFEAMGISPGSYSVVAAGDDGFAVFGVTAVASDLLTPALQAAQTEHRMVSLTNELDADDAVTVPENLQIDAALIDWQILPAEETERIEALFGCCSCDASGGGVGGGSGLLGLLGLAGLAGLDNGKDPASPAAP